MNRAELVVIADAERHRRASDAGRLAWIAAASVIVLVLAVQPFSDSNVWWHLALGRLITTSGIPAHEPFSFLQAAHAWVGQQWLYDVTLAGLVGAGGAGLASLIMGLATTAAVVLAALSVPRTARITGPWLALSMVVTGLVITSAVGVTSSVISVLGVAIVIHVVSRWREGRTAAVWGLPPLFLVWANMDAGFAMGLLLLVAALLLIKPVEGTGPNRRQLGLVIALSAVGALANPAGPGIYTSIVSGVLDPGVAQNLAGWASPDFHEWSARLLEAEVVLVIALWTISGGPDRYSVVTGFGLLVATLFARENLAIFAIFLAPQVALHGSLAWHRHVSPRLGGRWQALPRRLHPIATSALLLALTAAMAAVLVPQLSPSAAAAYQASTYPEAAAGFVAAHFPGERVYTTDAWGGYLAYRFPAGRVVFLYDEPAVFGDAALQRYLDVDQLRPDWVKVLKNDGIAHAILPIDARETAALHVLGWTVDCSDATSRSIVMSAPPAGTVSTPSGTPIVPEGVAAC